MGITIAEGWDIWETFQKVGGKYLTGRNYRKRSWEVGEGVVVGKAKHQQHVCYYAAATAVASWR